ncbi:MAG: hypothetical protein [Caudoviricetes sp.]|nr:MAG: hypothetical protein [Caudoviricetes sp.]
MIYFAIYAICVCLFIRMLGDYPEPESKKEMIQSFVMFLTFGLTCFTAMTYITPLL